MLKESLGAVLARGIIYFLKKIIDEHFFQKLSRRGGGGGRIMLKVGV